jgi:hypothetical protein
MAAIGSTHADGRTIVSRHLLRRRARAVAKQRGRSFAGPYAVVKAERGPWRWYVVRG